MPRRIRSAAAMPSRSRRDFLLASATVAGGYWIAPKSRAAEGAVPTSANEEVRFACIGIGGKGKSDSADADRSGKVVAVADVDANQLKRAETAFDGTKQYTDFRVMLDEMGKSIDAVTVSTPDHTHITAAAMAMNMGKHCFCQKPLTRSIADARLLTDIARSQKVATQMGNHGTADSALRRTAAVIKSGEIGAVKEVHIWTNRPIWPQGGNRPVESAAPAHLKWDLWIGPSPARPYAAGYHPFAWRGYWDFGSGALGDMGCHSINMPFMALNLRDPISVQAMTSGHNKETFPKWSIIDFDFPALGGRSALKLRWYDGGKLPEQSLFAGFAGEVKKNNDGKEVEHPFTTAGSGMLLVGQKDSLYCPGDHCEKGFFLKSGRVIGDVDFPQSPGHFLEFVDAIKGGPQGMANFPDYAGPLTETVLLGNLAIWAASSPDTMGKKIEWDPVGLVAKNAPEVDAIIRPVCRDGWKV